MSEPRRYSNNNGNSQNFNGNGAMNYGYNTQAFPPPAPPAGFPQGVPYIPYHQPIAPLPSSYYQYAPVYHDPQQVQQFYQQQQQQQQYYQIPPFQQMPPQFQVHPVAASPSTGSTPVISTPSSTSTSTTSTYTPKKMRYQNQRFIPQKDHDQYLQESKINNNNNNNHIYNQPPQPYNNNNNNNNLNSQNINSPLSASSIGQTSPDRTNITTASSPPSSAQSTTPKLSQASSTTPSNTSDSIADNESHPIVNGHAGGESDTTTTATSSEGFIVNSKVAINKPPFFFGTSKAQLTSQKKKFKAKREEKKLKEEEEEKAAEKKDEEIKDKVEEPVLENKTPSPQVTKPVVAKWSFIAEQAAKKNSPKSTTPTTTSNSSPVTKKETELRYVPSVSNVLEPLGVVLLRSMFDKNFQKAFVNSNKLPKIVPRGLVNTGNICFMSSILQLLLYCQPFFQSLNIISSKTIQSLNKSSSTTPLIDAVIELFKNFNIKLDDDKLGNGFGDSFVPEQFYKEISQHSRFSHLQWGQQEDAEEFFGYLLDGLHEEFISSVKNLKDNDIKMLLDSITSEEVRTLIKQSLENFSNEEDFKSKNESNNNNNNSSSLTSDDGWHEVGNNKKKVSAKRTVEVKPSPIRQLFGGQFRSVLDVPKQRESQSITLDPFQQVQLDISDDNINTLEDAFKHLSQVEELQYKSDDGSDVIAKKQTFIDKLPEVLIVHLKRFSFVNKSSQNDDLKNGYSNHLHSGRIEKIGKKIKYDHDFTIPTDCISSATRKFNPNLNYKLIGVVYHHGISSEGGHYTVDVLRKELGEWIRIDDTKITKLKAQEVLSGDNDNNVKTAYILMYQKVNN